jgi:ATP-dependent DNA ligase
MFEPALQLHLEGVVGKRANSVYQQALAHQIGSS